jgi:hypothetical protein
LYTKLSTLIQAAVDRNSTLPVLCTRLQDQHGGSEYYNTQHQRLVWPAIPAAVNPNHLNDDPIQPRPFRAVFRALFFTVFRPSNLVLQQLVIDTMSLENQILHSAYNQSLLLDTAGSSSTLQLWPTPHNMTTVSTIPYVVAHLRAYYGSHSNVVSFPQIANRATNAIQCASHHFIPRILQQQQQSYVSSIAVRPHNSSSPLQAQISIPILFLSDASLAVDCITKQQRRRDTHVDSHQHPLVLTLPRGGTNPDSSTTTMAQEPPPPPPRATADGRRDAIVLHLDQSTSRVATDYVTVCTDLWFMSQALCISYGQGGYGRMGSLLLQNPNCIYNYFQQTQFLPCPPSSS